MRTERLSQRWNIWEQLTWSLQSISFPMWIRIASTWMGSLWQNRGGIPPATAMRGGAPMCRWTGTSIPPRSLRSRKRMIMWTRRPGQCHREAFWNVLRVRPRQDVNLKKWRSPKVSRLEHLKLEGRRWVRSNCKKGRVRVNLNWPCLLLQSAHVMVHTAALITAEIWQVIVPPCWKASGTGAKPRLCPSPSHHGGLTNWRTKTQLLRNWGWHVSDNSPWEPWSRTGPEPGNVLPDCSALVGFLLLLEPFVSILIPTLFGAWRQPAPSLHSTLL